MKPVRLTLQAWGPFAGREEVDFSKLSGKGMFLITGPTGSGKTTVFDGIAYALYGNVSGSVRERNGLRSDFAKPEAESFAELEFIQHGKLYRIRRTPRYERLKKRGEGTVTSPETACLYETEGALSDAGNDSSAAHSAGAKTSSEVYAEASAESFAPVTALAEVNRRIEELLGMNYDQFRQIAMIAQGEFMNMLVQKSSDRVEILRSIFRTGIYDRIEKKLSEESRNRSREVAALRDRMAETAGTIDAGEDEVMAELLQAADLHYEAILSELERLLAEEQQQERQLTEERAEREEKVSHLRAGLQLVRETNRQLADRERWRARLEELAGGEKEQQKKKEQLRQARVAEQAAGKELLYQKAKERVAESEARLAENRTELEGWQPRIAQIPVLRAELERLEIQSKRLTSAEEALGEVMRLREELRQAEQDFITISGKYEAQEKEVQEQKSLYEELERRYRDAVIGRAASYLLPGEPCPVCGSREHPDIAAIPAEAPEESEVEAARLAYEKLHAEGQEILRSAAAAKAVVQEKTKGTQRAWEQYGEYRYLSESEAGMAEVGTSSAAAGLSGVEQETVQNADLSGIAATLSESLSAVKKQLSEDQQELEQCVRQQELLAARIAEWETVCKQAEAEQERSEAEYRRAVMESGFADEESYRKAVLSPERQNELIQETERFDRELLEAKTQYQVLEKSLAGKKYQEESGLVEELSAAETEQNSARDRLEKIRLKLTVNSSARNSLLEKQEKRRAAEKRYGIVQDLARTASGGNREHLVLEQYVLSVYLEEIIRAANLRLSPMSMGRYELAKVEQVGDARTKDSLGLEIIDAYTGKRRSVRSLSGGESFKAALSLSLGLSDMIQSYAGGIEIDMFFIDEGFGSLDQESLDQAVTTLSRLAGEQKSIGIISHVAELKERIPEQITIRKTSTGSHIAQ